MTKVYKWTAFLLFLCLNISTLAQTVFINEFHYDNDGGDTQEGVEIAGPYGTDLSGWSLEFYNGNGGASYASLSLSGVINDQQNGFGTIFYSETGVQNGSPDGMALIDNNGNVIQFLSYEGSFTAVGGPADGMLSTDIGVEESGSTAVSYSLQLIGTGTTYSDFSWQSPITNTYNGINTGQTFETIITDPLINEFVFNHTGADAYEFVEIYGTPEFDLSQYTLIEIEGDGAGAGTIDGIFNLTTTDNNGYWTTGFLSNAFENGTVTLLLVNEFSGTEGDDIDTDNDGIVDVMLWGQELDGIGVSDGGAEDLNYTNAILDASFDGGSFTVGGASRIPNGVDTDTTEDWVRNSFEGAGLPAFPGVQSAPGEATNTPGAENSAELTTPETVVLINEIDVDTESTDIAEFIELYDGGTGNTALDGLVVVLYNGSNDQVYESFDLDGYTTDVNGYFVLGNAGVPNVSLEFSSNTLQNGADAVALYEGEASAFPSGTDLTLTGLVDAVVYDTNDSDDAELLTLLNEGEPQVNEDQQGDKDIHSLQRFPNGGGGLRNTGSYVSAIPTPGASNTNITEPVNLLINEIDADTPGSDTAEFIELYDGGTGNSPLDGYVLVFFNGNGDASYSAIDLDGYTTNAEGYFVLGNAGVANVDLTFSNNGLQNGADAIGLYQASAADFPSGTLVTTEGLIDAAVYDTDDSDDTELLVLLNAGEPQINENAGGDKDNESLQRLPNGSGGLRNTSSYSTASPTPGAENGAVVEPGELVTIAEARAASLGTAVTVRGVLTVSDQFAGPAYIQDSTGGIAVFDAAVHGELVLEIGDSVEISAALDAFNDQIQLASVTNVIDFGPASHPIIPEVITLSELSMYPGELVTVLNTTFPNPGDILFGNSNYVINDVSGSGELRVDGDVGEIVGYAQPETCSEITGVIGRFQTVYQLLPRQASDLPCTDDYEPSGEDLTIPRSETFDVAAWNIEWFGDEANSPAAGGPNADDIQKDSVKAVIMALDADIIGVEEVVDTVLFAQLVSELPGYDYVLSNFVSNPGQYDNAQRVGFIYNNATVSPRMDESRALLSTIHPLYNGGDDSYLVGYPDARDRFWASGRLPYMLVADVSINGITKTMHMLSVHARANSGTDAQSRYDMRKYDVEALKDSLDAYYNDVNLVMLGDFNDDLDETVADVSTTVTTYEEYVQDTSSYKLLTLPLSQMGLRTYVFYENVIDHIIASDEASEYFLGGSARVGYQFYDSDYSQNTSDHLPVSARFKFTEEVTSNDFTAVEVVSFNQGKRKNGWPVSFIRSNPERALGTPLENFYYNFVSLGFGGEITLKLDNYMYDLPGDEFRVFESTLGPLELPCFLYPEKAEISASEDGNTFYTLGTACQNGDFDLSVSGLSRAQYLKIKDTSNKRRFISLADGYDLDGIYNLHPASENGRVMQLSDHENYVPNEDGAIEVSAYPNPFSNELKLNINTLEDGTATVKIIDIMGKEYLNRPLKLASGASTIDLELSHLPKGIYLLQLKGEKEGMDLMMKVIKE